MASNDFEDGVWRTVGGRRIFIKDGESLSSAMKKSRKFKDTKKKQSEQEPKTTDKESQNEKKYSDKQVEMVWENEDATEIYNHLTAGERNKLNQAYDDAQSGNKSAQEYIEKTERKAAEKFLEKHRNDKDYEGYYMSDKYVAEENKKADIGNQKFDIEKASGMKVKEAFETDLYGNGKADRFVLEDDRIVEHTTESFGQKEDTWSVHPKGMQGESKHYDSYDKMIEDLGKSESKSTNSGAYKKAFEEYKKQHPNTKLTLQKFINMSEGK